MVEKLSKEQQAEYAEDIEYYEDSHSTKRKPAKAESHEHDWDSERRTHEKHEQRESRADEIREREEMMEEVEYHETHHQAPRGKTPRKESPAFEYEVVQPGHGQTAFLSPFEISQYREELDYKEKNHPSKKKQAPMTLAESFGFETGSIMHGEEHAAKKMPMGMFGYDLELGYHERTRPYQESTGEKLQRYGRMIGGIRDDLYGYRDYNSRNYTPTQFGSLDFGMQQKRIRSRPLHHSNVGRINFFHDTRGKGLMSMDPFGLSGNSRSKSGRKKRGRPASGRSSGGSDPMGLPPSLAWMF